MKTTVLFVSVVWVIFLELRKGLLNNEFLSVSVCMCVCRLVQSELFCEQRQHHCNYSQVNCRNCYTAECICESLSLVSQDFNSNRGMTL